MSKADKAQAHQPRSLTPKCRLHQADWAVMTTLNNALVSSDPATNVAIILDKKEALPVKITATDSMRIGMADIINSLILDKTDKEGTDILDKISMEQEAITEWGLHSINQDREARQIKTGSQMLAVMSIIIVTWPFTNSLVDLLIKISAPDRDCLGSMVQGQKARDSSNMTGNRLIIWNIDKREEGQSKLLRREELGKLRPQTSN